AGRDRLHDGAPVPPLVPAGAVARRAVRVVPVAHHRARTRAPGHAPASAAPPALTAGRSTSTYADGARGSRSSCVVTAGRTGCIEEGPTTMASAAAAKGWPTIPAMVADAEAYGDQLAV